MKIEEKQITQFKITELKNLDPITVYIDEWQDEEYKGCCDADIRYQGRIIIQCNDVTLSYFWNAMPKPLKEFFITASTCYIAEKFKMSAKATFRPIDIEMLNQIIETVKEAFSELIKQEGMNEGRKV